VTIPVARPLRLHVPGGFYHVTLRGNHRQPIFRTSGDRELLDDIVAETVEQLAARIHAYCWMTNHIHVLIQVTSTPLGKIILRIASKYARAFQRTLATTGHLFERRYHGILVEADRYLLTLVRYVHLNPVRAGLVADPCDYLWSSHRDYLGLARHDWLHTSFTLNTLSANVSSARVAYSRLIGGPGELRWGSGVLVTHPDNPQVMGSDDFLKKLAVTGWQSCKPVDLEELVRECASRFTLTDAELSGRSRSRRLAAARAWLVHEALSRGVASVSAVARRLNRSEAALRGLMSRHPHKPGK
jgi:REP element-mobilizing transposase RayT